MSSISWPDSTASPATKAAAIATIQSFGCAGARSSSMPTTRAWALLGHAQAASRQIGGTGEDGLAAAERALAIDGSLAEAHALKARVLMQRAIFDEAEQETET